MHCRPRSELVMYRIMIEIGKPVVPNQTACTENLATNINVMMCQKATPVTWSHTREFPIL